jgi:alkanesulfonate monooxygenase SsuD/methylene tetrahydromethanopterin reductase-like flavin-dependent oxidoreductase (luciferase family)
VTFPLRFHVLLLPNVSWAEFRSRVIRLEELGFEVAGVADHLVDWTNPPAPWFEAWTSLAALAEATSRIRLTTLVTQIPLRNPAMLARQVVTLDHISGGRVELGIGTGLTIDPSYAMGGFPNYSAKERVDRFGEYVEAVAQMLAQEVTTFHGEHYAVDGIVMNPRPVQSPRPPIMIAAMGDRMLRRAARHADIWNSLSFLHDVDSQLAETAERCAAIDGYCADIGRDPASLRRSYTMFDGEARHRGGAIGYYDSPQAFIDQVSRVIALGISDVGVYYPLDARQLATFESIATDVLPALRAEHAEV